MQQNLYSKVVADLLSNHQAHFSLPIHRLTKLLIPQFLKLTNETEEFRKPWFIDLSGDDKEPDDGLIERNGGVHDHKLFFHHSPGLLRHLTNNHAKTDDYLSFLKDCDRLYNVLATAMEEVAYSFDEAHRNLKFNLYEKMMKVPYNKRHKLRFLSYKKGNTVLAQGHFDRCALTFHVAESHSGLHLNGNPQFYEAHPNQVLLFPGMSTQIATDNKLSLSGNFKEALEGNWRSNPLISAGFHEVKQTSDDARWSIVFFSHLDLGLQPSELSKIAKKAAVEWKEKAMAV
jgi:hypothetical protein